MKLRDHLDKLSSFVAIVDAGTMREAAAKLRVTQPSLTRLIQTLEGAAGTRLLERGRSGVQATEAGRRLLEFARETLKQLEDMEARLRDPTDQLAGHLRVGSYETLAEYLWPDFIADFRKKSPQLKISVRTNDSASHLAFLANGGLDLLVDAEPRLTGDFISWPLFEDRFGCFASPKNATAVAPGKGLSSLEPGTISDLPLIYCPAAFDRENKSISLHLEEAGYQFREKIELDSFPSVMAFARKGIGLGVLPNRLADMAVKRGDLHPVHLKGLPKAFGAHGMVATARSHRKDDPRVRHLVRALREWFRD